MDFDNMLNPGWRDGYNYGQQGGSGSGGNNNNYNEPPPPKRFHVNWICCRCGYGLNPRNKFVCAGRIKQTYIGRDGNEYYYDPPIYERCNHQKCDNCTPGDKDGKLTQVAKTSRHHTGPDRKGRW